MSLLGHYRAGRAVYRANDALVDLMISVLQDDLMPARIDKEYLRIYNFIFDLYRGQIYSCYREPIWPDMKKSTVVEKSVPVSNLSWRQRRRLRTAVQARLNRHIAQTLRDETRSLRVSEAASSA
jgi:hypothetical protein